MEPVDELREVGITGAEREPPLAVSRDDVLDNGTLQANMGRLMILNRLALQDWMEMRQDRIVRRVLQ